MEIKKSGPANSRGKGRENQTEAKGPGWGLDPTGTATFVCSPRTDVPQPQDHKPTSQGAAYTRVCR